MLDQYGYTRADMNEILDEYDLRWPVFEASVRRYMLMNRFVDEVLLADLALTPRQAALGDWMSGQVEAADMTFDPLFLAGINRPEASPPLPR